MTPALGPGSRVGRFEISGILGSGAMGSVFLAHDPNIDRPVAIKTLRSDPAAGELAREIEGRFLKEARLAGRLQHPNIVTIYEAGEDRGIYYIAMEYVDGDALSRALTSENRMSVTERIDVVRQVALALQHAHERGVLHRDIKPGNILVTRDGRVKVADFGIGKLLSGAGDMTRTGQMIGSPAYMSPEQIRGEKLDGRSDFFSLGVVLYELLTGKRPFPGDSITTLVYQILHTDPPDPTTIRSDLPASTRDVFGRLLAKSPDKRPAGAVEFLRELQRVEKDASEQERTVSFALPPRTAERIGPPPVAPPAEPAAAAALPPPPAERRGGRPSAASLLGAAALLLAAGALVLVWRRSERGTAVAPAPTSVPAASAAVSTAVPTASLAEISVPTPEAFPTAGSSRAADAIVGAPRYASAAARPPTRTPRVAAVPTPRAETVAEAAPAPPPARASLPPADNLYRTRRFAKFGVSPDQARIYLDGRYVGIADDWDDRGGGKTLEIGQEGTHRVRLELPGYRTLHLDIIETSAANDETVDVNDELKRESKVPYPKIPKVDDRTVGPVELQVDPPDATVSEGSRTLGPASAFGPGSPLMLKGPMVHDVVLSAPGHKPRTVRILVASNADNDRAKVKVTLKKE
jgi:predicted Ser/Thr protein kinase